MGIFEAVLLGVLQGLTEFLPVSSSGHLVLMQKIFDISEPTLLFDTMLHLGTLAAVFVALRKDIWAIMKRPFQKLTWLVILATVPTVVIALLFRDAIEAAFHSGSTLGFGFLITAALLVFSEFLSSRSGPARGEKEMGVLDALLIGTLQGVAILPAISRSGSTIAGALSRRLDRDLAARFSFLMSIPAILGAAVLQGMDLLDPEAADVAFGGISAAAVIAGTLSAAVVGFFAVSFMLKMIRERKLTPFALYVAVLGAAILADQFIFHIFF